MAKKGTVPPKAFNKISKEEARTIQSKGGLASSKARRKRKAFREELKILLELADKEGVTNNTKVSIALLNEALDGNVKAFETIRDTIGEKPIDRQEVKEVTSEWFK
jgi:hypothetical protein